MADSIRRLPDSELVVMQAVWQATPPVSRTVLEEILQPDHPMAQTTLLTLLSRLTEKGFLQVEKAGKTNYYIPCVTREAYVSAQGRRFVDQLCGGSISAFASALCDGALSKQEIQQLRKLLEEDRL